MTEKQKTIAGLCSQILDVTNPNDGTLVDELSMAVLQLRCSAALIWRLACAQAVSAGDRDTIASKVIDGKMHYLVIDARGGVPVWAPVKEASNG